MTVGHGYVWVPATLVAAQASTLIERRRARLKREWEAMIQRVMSDGVLEFSFRRMRLVKRELTRAEAQLEIETRRWRVLEWNLIASPGHDNGKLLEELLKAAEHSATTSMLLSTYAVAVLKAAEEPTDER